MVYRILTYWISFVFPTFYKRIQIKNIEHLRIKAPIIIAMNHPNAFTDPVGLTFIAYPTRFKFLARGDAFKPGFVSWVLDKIGIVPIYRIQDGGKDGLHKNEETYNRVNEYLKKNAKVIVFAEGLCIMERRLRPIKKGVARMVFGAYDFLNDERLLIVPVGVNYSQPDKFRSSLFYNVGEPISLKEFLKDKSGHVAKNQNAFLQYLEPKLKELITHINDKANDELVVQAEELCKPSWMKNQGLDPENLEHDFIIQKQITQKINDLALVNPQLLEEFRTKALFYFHLLFQHKLRDWLFQPQNKHKVNSAFLFLRSLFLVACFPIFLLGYFANVIPHHLTLFLTNKVVKNREFFSSFAIAFSMIVFFVYYLLFFFLFYSLSPNVFYPLILVISGLLGAWFNLYYLPNCAKALGTLRVLRNKAIYNQLCAARAELLAMINKF